MQNREQPGNRSSPFELTGRVALVTGASRGLGYAMACALARAGAELIIWARNSRALECQARKISKFTARIFPQRVDVTNPSAVRKAVHSALRKTKRIDVLINNAGIWGGDAAITLDRRTWNNVIDTDLSAAFFVSQAVAPSMMRRRYGKIINVSSTSAFVVHPENAAYGSAKAGLVHLTRILAVEWGPYGVRVNAIAPGMFRTDMTKDSFEDRAWVRRRKAQIPLRRFGEPEEIGGSAVFLASSASDHITGQTIIIDAGASLTV